MGNRIHKNLLYGFKYCRFDSDKRFNDFFWSEEFQDRDLKPELLSFTEERRKDRYIDSFGAWLRGVGWHEGKDIPDKLYVSDFVHYSTWTHEKDNKIGPIGFSCESYREDWHRYDDIIDYIEAKSPKDSAVYIKDESGKFCGIYPHVIYINRNTGERCKCYPIDRWAGQEDKEFLESRGCSSFIEWQRYIVPRIPEDIYVFCKCFDVFKDPKIINYLKPMIYTYWS